MTALQLAEIADRTGFDEVADLLRAGGPEADELLTVVQSILTPTPEPRPSAAEGAQRLLTALSRAGFRPGQAVPSTSEATRLLRVWLRERGLEEDRWGNWKKPGVSDERYNLGDRVLRRQHRHTKELGGAWYNVSSQSLIQAAQNVLANLGKKVGDTSGLAVQAGYKAKLTAGRDRAKEAAVAARDENQLDRQRMADAIGTLRRWAEGGYRSHADAD